MVRAQCRGANALLGNTEAVVEHLTQGQSTGAAPALPPRLRPQPDETRPSARRTARVRLFAARRADRAVARRLTPFVGPARGAL